MSQFISRHILFCRGTFVAPVLKGECLGIFLCVLLSLIHAAASAATGRKASTEVDTLASALSIAAETDRNETIAATSARRRDSINADSVMARVFTFTQRYGLRAAAFRSSVYVRHTLATKRRNIFTRYMPDMLRLERGSHEYFGEQMSQYQFRPPAEVYKKDIASFSTMPYLRQERDGWIGRYSLSIYEPNIFTDRILSPVNRRNRKYYRYRYQLCYISKGRRVVCVQVKPRISNTQLVRGTLSIEEQTGRVVAFSLSFSYGWSHIQVVGEMGRDGQSALMPNRILLTSRLRFLGNRIEEAYEAKANYQMEKFTERVEVEKHNRFDLTRLYQLHTDTTSMRRDKAYFDQHRPFPLQPRQQAIYDRAASRDSLHANVQPVDSVSREKASGRHVFRMSDATENLLFDSHTLSIAPSTRLKLPAMLTPSMVQWSRSRGMTLQTRLNLHADFTRQRSLEFAPRVGYNFKERQVYWHLPLRLNVLPRHDGCFTLEASGGDHIYNARQADEVRQRLHGITNYDSLTKVFDTYDFSYYRDNRLLATFAFSPVVGLRLSAGWRLHRRNLLQWNEVAAANGMARTLTGFAPRLSVSWTPALYHYRDGNGHAVPLRSKWPTFMVDYERGLSTFNASTSYERIETDVQYTLPLYALRALYFRGGCGFFTRRGPDCFLDYDYFRNNHLFGNWNDELSGQFQLLDARWYNESRHYVRLSAAYESPMMLFSRLRWLTRVVQKERLYINLLNVGTLGYYSEWGYGLSTPIVDVAGFIALAGHSQTGIGVKFVLRLGD